ncbi:MAG: hypothetical protein LKF87_03995 [Clostridium tyrobutyricum]|jgi:hypothetical protein|uniref:hypothetical protein n=1 Tax=Clostridium tyrobutyricum TaxID=1519 RepID=UPI00189C95D7|nr:hypothetical protein [Clostridium tyrobutyricum]MCH4199234.1 hypothetical protein [Clostridium tyrobutyricum]MCH4258118.1 hypothetical protein [Clostridium tyrobutyricum]MCI1239157.1 hypothetical protein [Clostridium tyrobutyricum]MCI1651371.1 hypothetical protein [Clostridium tyrobutyricum]MCI1937360.1 hypothetical protein [Clostridium tyrobutyricum]
MDTNISKELVEQFDLLREQCQKITSEEVIEPEQYDFLIKASLAMVQIANCLNV